MFREIFAHPQERKDVFYSLWYNAPKLLPAGGLESGGTDYVFGVEDEQNNCCRYTEHGIISSCVISSL